MQPNAMFNRKHCSVPAHTIVLDLLMHFVSNDFQSFRFSLYQMANSNSQVTFSVDKSRWHENLGNDKEKIRTSTLLEL